MLLRLIHRYPSACGGHLSIGVSKGEQCNSPLWSLMGCMSHKRYFLIALCLCGLLTGIAHAALTIEITQGIQGATPIAIVPFGSAPGAAPPPEDIAAIVTADLGGSGRFSTLPLGDMLERPTDGSQVNFKNWRMLGSDNLVIGKVRPGSGGYTVQFQLFDVFQGKQLLGYSIPAGASELRRVAHHISDLIYEKLTGIRGAFNTRIAYVTATRGANRSYVLKVADADGYNASTILSSREPLMSPAWSPDGKRLAYVSFEKKRSEIYVQEIASGARQRIAGFDGANQAPAWSPDGRRLAVSLSRGGNLDLYVLDVSGSNLQRVTDNPAIDTEPVWAPDGNTLYFTSDRGGKPQIYEVAANGGSAQRITFEGDYNTRPRVSPDGRYIAMVHRNGGRYTIAVLDTQTRALNVLSDGPLDESPSFAPNGSMILYAAADRGRGVLSAVSIDGKVRQLLVLQEGNVREPAWSPYLQ